MSKMPQNLNNGKTVHFFRVSEKATFVEIFLINLRHYISFLAQSVRITKIHHSLFRLYSR